MKILVGQHELKIDKKDKVNQNEYKITKCEFEFDEAITNDLVKIALFTNSAGTYKQYIINNECDIPAEILEKQETTTLGVYAYKEENGELELRYSPEEIKFYVSNGSYKENAENTEPITPTDKEQMEQAIQDMETKVDNLDIEAEKVDKTTTITITKKDGTQEEVEILDGLSLEYNWLDTSLGIKREDEQNYQYVDLKGEKGDAGAIKMLIVNELPTTGEQDTIYLVPLEEPESQENRYAEYVYINNAWELLGKIGIEVSLDDYYTKTETNNLLNTKQPSITNDNKLPYTLISGTPTIPSKTSDLTNDSDFTTKTYVDNIVGDIETILTTLDVGSGV